MTREKIDLGIEKKIVTALATSREFLASAATLIDTRLFQTRYAAQVADWCLDHWKNHGEPAGKGLEITYHGWIASESPKDEDADAVSAFLEHLSAQHDEEPTFNIPHLTAVTAKYMTAQKVKELVETITIHTSRAELDQAVQAISDFRQTAAAEVSFYNPLGGKSVTASTYAEPIAPIIEMPGAAGKFFGLAFRRGALVGIQGHEKLGKTWMCMEMVYRALRSRRKVFMFTIGDETDREIKLRWDVRLAGIPLVAQTVEYPVEMKLEGDSRSRDCQAVIGTQTRVFEQGIYERAAWKAHKLFHRTHRLGPSELHVLFESRPTFSINVKGMHNILKQAEYEEGFQPEVIVIDYADNLGPEKERRDSREQINETWGSLRRLAQEWNACVIVPTQGDSGSYDVWLQTMKNFSNDKRKNAHVTAMMGLNQTNEEKDQGVIRLNWLNKRGENYNPTQCLWVAQCIPLGLPMVRSVW